MGRPPATLEDKGETLGRCTLLSVQAVACSPKNNVSVANTDDIVLVTVQK